MSLAFMGDRRWPRMLRSPIHQAVSEGLHWALNVASEGDVDAYFQQALAAGGQKIKQPEKVFWGGYSGYFADLDGHLWEVAHNPFFQGDSKTGQLKLEGVQP